VHERAGHFNPGRASVFVFDHPPAACRLGLVPLPISRHDDVQHYLHRGIVDASNERVPAVVGKVPRVSQIVRARIFATLASDGALLVHRAWEHDYGGGRDDLESHRGEKERFCISGARPRRISANGQFERGYNQRSSLPFRVLAGNHFKLCVPCRFARPFFFLERRSAIKAARGHKQKKNKKKKKKKNLEKKSRYEPGPVMMVKGGKHNKHIFTV